MTPPHTSNTSLHNGALAETAPDPIITIDEVSTILYVNSAAERAFGYMASELVGQPLSMLIPERLRARHSEGMNRYIATGKRRIPWQGLRVPIRTKSGIEIPVDISFGEFEWNGQRVFSGFLRDISERVASENEIAAANELLQQQATELEQQVEEGQALMGELAQANHDAEMRAHLAARSADRARRLLALSTGLNQAVRTEEVADLILDAGLSAVGADAGTFALLSYNEGKAPEFEIIHARGFAKELTAEYRHFPLHQGRPISDAVLTRAPVLVESRKDARARYPMVADVGFEAFVALPVVIGGKVVAAIAFSFSDPQKFDEPTETFLRTVGELSAQALERARLYEDRDRRSAHSGFLAEVSRLLASSLDYETTLKALAEAAVPTLADWCIVDIVDDPTITEWPPKITRLAVAHKDPAKRAIVSSLRERVPIDWDSQTGLAPVLLHGATQFQPVVTDEMLVERARTDEHLAILRDLAYTSVIRVPLLARDRTLGALTLLRSDVNHPYDEHDVVLATDLGARAATAIDNARLFRDAQQARVVAEEAMARADLASSAKTNFLATMSHEIRTPINAVLGYSELLEMELAGPLTDDQRAQVARIRASTGHLLTLVNEVLDLAKIESGTLRVEAHESMAGDTANAALALVSPQAAARGIMISETCGGDCAARYVGDADRVRQVLANLIGNAVKFTKPGGSVSLTCAVVDDPPVADSLRSGERYVAFKVTDTGVGIPAEDLESIFEAFVQSESRSRNPYTREQTGTGLGLAISRQLANQMSGEIIVASQPGIGSTFTLFIPAA